MERKPNRSKSSCRWNRRRLLCESLEDRRLLAAGDILVTDQTLESLIRVDPSSGNRSVISGGTNATSQVGSGGNFRQTQEVLIESSGDFIVPDRDFDEDADTNGDDDHIIRVDSTSGNRTILSGPTTGSGPVLAQLTGGAIATDGTIYVGDQTLEAIVSVDPVTGNRTVVSAGLNGTGGVMQRGSGGNFRQAIEIGVESNGNLIVPDRDYDFNADGSGDDDHVLRIDPATGNRTILSGPSTGTGPVLAQILGLVITDTGTIYLGDQTLEALISLDPASGNRTVVAAGTNGTGGVTQRGSGGNFRQLESVAIEASGSLIVTDRDYDANADGSGDGDHVLRVDPATGNRVIVAGPSTGSGTVLAQLSGLAIIPTPPSNPDVNLLVSTNSGTESAGTVVTVTANAAGNVSGNQTVDLGVTGTGIAAGDYVLSNTTITIPDGSSSGQVTFTVQDDNVVETLIETATLTISNPSSGITIGATDSQNVAITDNDALISNLVFTDTNSDGDQTGDSGRDGVTVNLLDNAGSPTGQSTVTAGGGLYSFTVTAGTYIVEFVAPPGTVFSPRDAVADNIDSDADPTTGRTAQLTVAGGQTNDTVDAGLVGLEAPQFAKVFGPNTIFAGDASTLTFTIDNSASALTASSLDFTDNLPAAVVVATPAAASTSCTGGTLTAADGTGVISYTGGSVGAGASCTIQVDVTSNTPGMYVNTTGDLTSTSGNSGTASDTLEVLSSTQEVNLSLSANAGSETGGTAITVTATAAGNVNGDQTVDVAVTGSNVDGGDFTLSDMTITIPGGQSSGDVTFTVEDDGLVEALTETATLTISNPSSGLTLGTTTSRNVAITDNDSAVVTLSAETKNEGTGVVPTTYVFTVNLSAPVDISVDMTADTVDGTATAADDFTAVSGAAVSFAPTTTTKTVEVEVDADFKVELDEAFDLALSALTAGGRDVTFDGGLGTLSEKADVLNDDSTVGGTPPIVDDSGTGFNLQGNWSVINRNGHDGGFRWANSGTGNNTATWAFDLVPGQYRVQAAWRAWPNRATNAPYTIFDGNTPLMTVEVDQIAEPNDFLDPSGTPFYDLGTFDISSRRLKVVLSDAANGVVIADAIRVELVGGLVPGPEIQVSADGAPVDDNVGVVEFGQAALGSTVTKSIMIENLGDADLNITSAVTVPAGFSLVTPPATTIPPGGSTVMEIGIDTASIGTRSGEVSFSVNDLDEDPFNFTMQGEVVAGVRIIDNGGGGYTPFAGGTTVNRNGHEGDFQWANSGTGANVARWTFNVDPGDYVVAAAWREYTNRATDATYDIRDGAGGAILASPQVNQQVAPIANYVEGTTPYDKFQTLGTVTISGSQLVIELSDAANGVVIADAIRIERIVAIL